MMYARRILACTIVYCSFYAMNDQLSTYQKPSPNYQRLIDVIGQETQNITRARQRANKLAEERAKKRLFETISSYSIASGIDVRGIFATTVTFDKNTELQILLSKKQKEKKTCWSNTCCSGCCCVQ